MTDQTYRSVIGWLTPLYWKITEIDDPVIQDVFFTYMSLSAMKHVGTVV